MGLFDFTRTRARREALDQALSDPAAPPISEAPTRADSMPTIKPEPASPAAPAVDTSKWDVDSFGIPKYTASNFGSAPSGWDATKWADPNHQTPKYVWGRIYQEARASGDPNWKQQAIDRLVQAYPGMKYGGEDVVYTPWGEEVDVFGDYGDDPRSKNFVSWGVNSGPGKPQTSLGDLLGQNVGASLAGPGMAVGAGSKIKEILDQINATANEQGPTAAPPPDPLAQQQAIRDQARRDALTRGFERGA